MTRRKREERLKREVLNWLQLCDSGNTKKNHCVLECVEEMYDEKFYEWLRR